MDRARQQLRGGSGSATASESTSFGLFIVITFRVVEPALKAVTLTAMTCAAYLCTCDFSVSSRVHRGQCRRPQITANEIASELVCGAHHDEASSRGIDDDISWLSNCTDQPRDEADWL